MKRAGSGLVVVGVVGILSGLIGACVTGLHVNAERSQGPANAVEVAEHADLSGNGDSLLPARDVPTLAPLQPEAVLPAGVICVQVEVESVAGEEP